MERWHSCATIIKLKCTTNTNRQRHGTPTSHLTQRLSLRRTITAGMQASHSQIPARRRHLRGWVEFKRTLGRRGIRTTTEKVSTRIASVVRDHRSLTRLQRFSDMALPAKLGQWRIASGTLPPRLNSKTNPTYILFKSP